jgi:hypothetical protein
MGDVEQYHHFKSVDDIGECKFKFTVEDTDNLEE